MKPGEIATISLLIFLFITTVLQFLMYWERAKFNRGIYGKGFFDKDESPLHRFEREIVTVFPVKLAHTENPTLSAIRKKANNYRRLWFISLILTFVVPIMIYKILSLIN